MWREISKGFEIHAKFPNCIVALDGKHIRMIQPENAGSLYFNYKHLFFACFNGIMWCILCFTWVGIGAYGKYGDSGIFKESTLCTKITEKTLNIPSPSPINNLDETTLPYVKVAYEAFGMMENLMRPYDGKLLS